jgi:hypothetical protein
MIRSRWKITDGLVSLNKSFNSWAFKMKKYEYEIQHVKNSSNTNKDVLNFSKLVVVSSMENYLNIVS